MPKLRPRGFTLVEEMTTVVIIAILAVGGLSLLGRGSIQYTRDTQRQADLERLRSALEMYRQDSHGYPQTSGWDSTLTSGKYLSSSSLPKDPLLNTSYTYSSCGSGRCTSYTLCAHLEKTDTDLCVGPGGLASALPGPAAAPAALPNVVLCYKYDSSKIYPGCCLQEHFNSCDNANGWYSASSTCNSCIMPTIPPTPTPIPPVLPPEEPPIEPGTGLLGDYYTDTAFTNYSASRIDPNLNYNLSPGSFWNYFVSDNTFSVIWTGWISPPTNDNYDFCINSDNDSSLYIDNLTTPVITKTGWVDTCLDTAQSKNISLQAGIKYNIKVKFMQSAGTARMILKWKKSGTSTYNVVPQTALYPKNLPAPAWHLAVTEFNGGCGTTINLTPTKNVTRMAVKMHSGAGDCRISYTCCGSSGIFAYDTASNAYLAGSGNGAMECNNQFFTDTFSAVTINKIYTHIGCNDNENMNFWFWLYF